MNTTEKKLLSICIPAYNEPEEICVVLDSITNELQDPAIASRVEVVIRDDASPAGSLAPIIAPYQKRHSNIRFSRNEQNLGFDRNLLAVVGDAHGRFCWLMSDNDAFISGALKTLISLLDEHPEVGHVFVTAKNYDAKLERELGRPSLPNTIQVIDSAEDLITSYDLPGFMSSQIVRKDLWDSVSKEKYLGNLWLHTSVILEYLPQTSSLYVGTPLIKARNKNSWVTGGKNLTTFLSLHDIIRNLPHLGYSRAFSDRFKKRFARDLPEVLAYAKRRGLKIRSNLIIGLIRRFWRYPLALLSAFLVLISPISALRQAHNISKAWIKTI